LPSILIAYGRRGYAYQEEGDRDKALADYAVVIRLKPKDAAEYDFRGIAFAEKGEYDKAIADYESTKTRKRNTVLDRPGSLRVFALS